MWNGTMSQEQSTSTNITETIPSKPQRPLTIFNIFSILERNHIVQQNQKRASHHPNASTDIHTDPYLSSRPERYRDVALPSNWFVVGMNRVKRSKHENHGVISFTDLTKEVSKQWKLVDAETRQYCDMIAADQLERYRRDMAAYEAMYGKDEVCTPKRKNNKHGKTNGTADNNDASCANKEDGSEGSSQRISSRATRLLETETGLPIEVKVKDTRNQATATTQRHWYMCSITQRREVDSGVNNHPRKSTASHRHSPTLSEYLPDDQEAALALVGNNYDNLLYGEELEKAFDSD